MTFARLARLLVLVAVVAALWSIRASDQPLRVAVLALPGAGPSLVFPSPEDDAGVGVIEVEPGMTGVDFWRRLFGEHPAGGGGAPSLSQPWSDPRSSTRYLAVPSRLLRTPGNPAARQGAFVGNSSGRVVGSRDVLAGRLPAPYDRALDEISAAASVLPRERWSDWIEVAASAGPRPEGPAPSAAFQFIRFTDSEYYFSPAYLAGQPGSAEAPFLRGLHRDLRPLVARHVIELSRRRLEPARTLFVGGAGPRAALVFDTVAEEAAQVFAPDSVASAVLEEVREALRERVARFREWIGPGGLLVVVGGPASTRGVVENAWYAVLDGGAGAGSGRSVLSTPLEFPQVRVLVRHLAGAELGPREVVQLPEEMKRRVAVRAGPRRAAGASAQEEPDLGWSAKSLEAVPGALANGG